MYACSCKNYLFLSFFFFFFLKFSHVKNRGSGPDPQTGSSVRISLNFLTRDFHLLLFASNSLLQAVPPRAVDTEASRTCSLS
jgi:hypothetical protein